MKDNLPNVYVKFDNYLLIVTSKNDLSKVSSCEIFTTDSLDKPPSLFDIEKFPGASAKRKFDVITATISVFIVLELNSLVSTLEHNRLGEK